ncbi:hypothetical protein ACFO0N_00280 [Halobium salinum]|uniref:Tat (Twin-arginine translocation) pathway signal sequence n=1 Tax=Halobium salinum TaxID=1364940 RepID=A0ABD5P676_9EURY|nr:hypothetical protein [Halobium salinum]
MPSTHSTRRRFLTTVAALGLATGSGCAGVAPSFGDGSGDDSNGGGTTLSLDLHRFDGSLAARHVVALSETRPSWDETAFEAALNGSDYTLRGRLPFPGSSEDRPQYVRRNGTYYRLDSVVVGQETVTHPVLRLYTVGRLTELDDPPEHVSKESLPEMDARAVEVAQMAARARGNVGGVPWGLVERGGTVYRSDDAEAQSELLGPDAPSHVSYRDRLYRIEVTRETFHETVRRPDVDPVAETDTELESVLRGRLVDATLDPDALSPDERRILETAESSRGYEATHPFPEPLVSLLKRLGHYAYVDGNVAKDAGVDPDGGRHLLRYGGGYAEYSLRLDGGGDN